MKRFTYYVLMLFAIMLSACTEQSDNLVFVEGGSFMMGDEFGAGTKDNGNNDERPVHPVTVKSFWICKYEVTQEEWSEVMATNPSIFPGDKNPVEGISWYDCIDYCNLRSLAEDLLPYYEIDKKNPDLANVNPFDTIKWKVTVNQEANGYRLPTEEEWEFAARGGLKSRKTKYSGSDSIEVVADYFSNNNISTIPVGSKRPNELGLHDMSGSLWEWCFNGYVRYPGNTDPDPDHYYSNDYKVLRGGAWSYEEEFCRIANRTGHGSNLKSDHYGLRVVRSKK